MYFSTSLFILFQFSVRTIYAYMPTDRGIMNLFKWAIPVVLDINIK